MYDLKNQLKKPEFFKNSGFAGAMLGSYLRTFYLAARRARGTIMITDDRRNFRLTGRLGGRPIV
jgi:hypothetical protein